MLFILVGLIFITAFALVSDLTYMLEACNLFSSSAHTLIGSYAILLGICIAIIFIKTALGIICFFFFHMLKFPNCSQMKNYLCIWLVCWSCIIKQSDVYFGMHYHISALCCMVSWSFITMVFRCLLCDVVRK